MKKFFWVIVVVLIATGVSNAQDKKWNIGIGAGLAIPSGDASDWVKTGVDGFVIGTYNFTSNFAAGVEVNYTNLRGKSINVGTVNVDVPDSKITAFLAKGTYTFTNLTVDPYFGAAVGFYSHKSDGTKVGLAGEAGIKYEKFGFGIAYHMAGKYDNITYSYVQLNFSYCFSF